MEFSNVIAYDSPDYFSEKSKYIPYYFWIINLIFALIDLYFINVGDIYKIIKYFALYVIIAAIIETIMMFYTYHYYYYSGYLIIYIFLVHNCYIFYNDRL